MPYQYKVIPFMGKLKSGGNISEISAQLETKINEQAVHGWEFYQMNDVNIEVTPGCLPAVLGQKSSYVSYDQLVFRKQI